jgi:hypothetical protein
MSHKEQNIDDYHSGDDLRIEVTVKDDGSTKDLTGSDATYEIFRDKFDSRDVKITKTVGDGISIVDAPNGRADVSISSSETSDMEGSYSHKMTVTDEAGHKSTVFTGEFFINE